MVVQIEVLGQGFGQSGSVGLAALAVIRGRALEDGLVPRPVLPAVRDEIFGHPLSVAEQIFAVATHQGVSATSPRPEILMTSPFLTTNVMLGTSPKIGSPPSI